MVRLCSGAAKGPGSSLWEEPSSGMATGMEGEEGLIEFCSNRSQRGRVLDLVIELIGFAGILAFLSQGCLVYLVWSESDLDEAAMHTHEKRGHGKHWLLSHNSYWIKASLSEQRRHKCYLCSDKHRMMSIRSSSVPETSISQPFKGTYAWTVTCNLLQWCLCGDTRHGNVTCDFCYTAFEVSQVDFFISHSWSGPAILKALAVCHHLNLDWAIASHIFATLFGICIFYFGFYRGESSYDSRESLETPCMWLKLFPITVFIVTYLFGHFIRKKTFWFDRISVNQVNLLVKSKTISQLPTFIARSSHLLVLWDDSFFARLWCNFELAVHAKLGPIDSIQIVPMWQPLWTVFLFGLQSIICFMYQYPQDQFDTKSRISLLISFVKAYTMPMSLYLLLATGLACFAFEKLKRHKSMLARMASFDIRNAKCALETDRIVIEEQVFRLFDEALEPALSVDLDDLGTDPGCGPRETPFLPLISPETLRDIRHITSYATKDEVMDQFNIYVRGPLRNAALSWTGQPGYISLKLCVVVVLPWQFASLFWLITCNGHNNCGEAYALEQGYSSMARFLGVNGACLFFLQNLSSFLIIPLLLRANEVIDEVVSDSVLKRLLGSLSGAMIFCVVDYLAQAQTGMLVVVATKYSPLWLAGFLVGLTLELIALRAVFRPPSSSSLRCLAPCKVTEKPYAM